MFQLALLLMCAGLAALAHLLGGVWLPILLLAVLAGWSGTSATAVPVLLLVQAASVGAVVTWTGAGTSPLLPYLLAPAAVAAVRSGFRAAVLVSGAAAAGLLGALLVASGVTTGALALAAGQWVLLGLALAALLAVLTGAEVAADPPDPYREVGLLLQELRTVARRLPGGLDVASSAEALLGDCAAGVSVLQGAVLVRLVGGALVPVAVRGTARVPWRSPLGEPGPLGDAWRSGRPVVDRRAADGDGPRRGSALLCLPLLSGTEPYGLVVLESRDTDAFGVEQVQSAVAAASGASVRLEAALLFAEVRGAVTVEERDRLAREVHDGVAQDLASFGYRLDELRARAGAVEEGLGAQVALVRGDLTRLISDLRLSITGLRTGVTGDRGLGAALTSYVRALGSGCSLRVHLTLAESAFRLPAEQEVLLFRVTQAIAQTTRKEAQVKNLWVDLAVDPPFARLVVQHDGEQDVAPDLTSFDAPLRAAGGGLVVGPRDGGGVTVSVVVEGATSEREGPAGR